MRRCTQDTESGAPAWSVRLPDTLGCFGKSKYPNLLWVAEFGDCLVPKNGGGEDA